MRSRKQRVWLRYLRKVTLAHGQYSVPHVVNISAFFSAPPPNERQYCSSKVLPSALLRDLRRSAASSVLCLCSIHQESTETHCAFRDRSMAWCCCSHILLSPQCSPWSQDRLQLPVNGLGSNPCPSCVLVSGRKAQAEAGRPSASNSAFSET